MENLIEDFFSFPTLLAVLLIIISTISLKYFDTPKMENHFQENKCGDKNVSTR